MGKNDDKYSSLAYGVHAISKAEPFEKEYFGKWGKQFNIEEYKTLIFYEYNCEKYDREICFNHDKDGFGMPFSLEEIRRSRANSLWHYTDAVRYVLKNNSNLTRNVKKLNWSQLEKEYKRLFEEGE
jgi:hypothetical protein